MHCTFDKDTLSQVKMDEWRSNKDNISCRKCEVFTWQELSHCYVAEFSFYIGIAD